MKLHHLFEDHGISLTIEKISDATDKDLVRFVMLSPLKVEAHYNDYPSIDKEAKKYFDAFFKKKYKAKEVTFGNYSFQVKDVEELRKLVQNMENYFNDEDYGDPGEQWSYVLKVTA